MQTRLDARMIKHGVVFAAGDKGAVGHICEHRPGALLSVEPKQGTRLWELVRGEIVRDGRECLAQFRSVASVASIAKTAEPVVALSLRDNRARPDDLPAFAPCVARGTDVIQPAKGRGQFFCLRQGALAGRLTRPIDVKDHPGSSCSIHQAPGLLLIRGIGEGATLEIVKKQRAQSFDGCLRQRRSKTGERRTRG
jgi:hypothetical protein